MTNEELENRKKEMNDLEIENIKASTRRQQAEELLKSRKSNVQKVLTEIDILKLIHELEVYQIELEMINEELRLAVSEAQEAIGLYDFAPIGYFTISKNGEIIRLNIAGADMLGKERQQLKNSRFGFFVRDDSKPIFNHFLDKIFSNKSKENCELTLLTNSEIIVHVQITGVVSKNEEECLLTMVDITKNKQVELALKDNQENFRNIVSNNPDHIFIQDNDLKYTFVVNPQIGLTVSDMIGKSDYDLTNKEDAEKITIIKQNVLTTGEPKYLETSLMLQSGELEYFRGTFTPKFDNSGKTNGLIGYFRNITQIKQAEFELKESEEKFKMIFEKTTAPIVIADDKGNYLAVNNATSELFEYTVDELVHMNVGAIITANGPDAVAQYEAYLAKGEETGEFGFISKNGTPKTVQYQAVRIKPDFNLSVMMDNTDQKRITEELKISKLHAEVATIEAEEAKQHAENAMNSKQRFLSNMSHEIRTPLNTIMGFTKILLKTDLNDKQKEFLLAIKTSSDSLIVLINDILDLAKVDAGKMVFEKRVFNLEESISAILHLFEPKILEKNLELVKVFNQQIPCTLIGDSARLHQILLNLLSNAVKFTSKGSITVSVDLLHDDNEKVTIGFAIKDTGIGIPKNKIDTIFNNFEQGSDFTSRVYGGTGLGLAISKQLIELQGGSISVQSEVEKGSTFGFILNFEKSNEIKQIHSTHIESVPESINIKVLVVEDVLLNQLLIKTILIDFGFECDLAGNGKIAIDKLQSNTYDIILMDLMMPEMNGFEATEHIRNKMNSEIPIIALSADVTTVDIEKCKALGMNDYVSKPIDEKLLFHKIVSLVK